MGKQCEEWVNFSVFKARMLAAGICAKDGDDFKAPGRDIPIGLGLETSSGKAAGGDGHENRDGNLLRDCKLMVSAQYILIAGETIKANINQNPYQGWDGQSWKKWATRFLEATTSSNLQETTKMAAKDAHDMMVRLWPDLFMNEAKHPGSEP